MNSFFFFQFTYFYFIIVYSSNVRDSKNRGSMDLVHIFDEPGPWTGSTEGVNGPGMFCTFSSSYAPTTKQCG